MGLPPKLAEKTIITLNFEALYSRGHEIWYREYEPARVLES